MICIWVRWLCNVFVDIYDYKNVLKCILSVGWLLGCEQTSFNHFKQTSFNHFHRIYLINFGWTYEHDTQNHVTWLLWLTKTSHVSSCCHLVITCLWFASNCLKVCELFQLPIAWFIFGTLWSFSSCEHLLFLCSRPVFMMNRKSQSKSYERYHRVHGTPKLSDFLMMSFSIPSPYREWNFFSLREN